MKAERHVQRPFSKLDVFNGLALVCLIMATAWWLDRQPTRRPAADAVVAGWAEPLEMRSGLRGWRLRAADERFGGLSALAIDRGELIALSDSGVVIRFAPPGASGGANGGASGGAMQVALHDLPAGPGSALAKSARDSESLLRDPRGRGWWVGFETIHSLFLFDQRFERAIERRRLEVDWPPNKGAEALASDIAGIMALPELGGRAVGGSVVAPTWTTEAARLADGRLLLLRRRPAWRGLVNELWIAAGHGQPARRVTLPVGMLDNMEGMAVEPRPDGGARLWLVSDDNFRPWMRTLLVSLDLAPDL